MNAMARWLKDNGIDPDLVPVDGVCEIILSWSPDEVYVRVDQYATDERGAVIPTHDRSDGVRERRVFRVVAAPEAQLAPEGTCMCRDAMECVDRVDIAPA